MYRIYDPDLFLAGQKQPLWRGMYGKVRERSLADFVGRLLELAPALARFVQVMSFWVAPLECEARIRQRVEAAIASHLYKQQGVVGEFQEADIR